MIALDVTDLARIKFSDPTINNAYLFSWEDAFGSGVLDFDYQDIAYIIFDIAPVPNNQSATPEPASALIFGLGTVLGVPAVRFFRRRRKKAGV